MRTLVATVALCALSVGTAQAAEAGKAVTVRAAPFPLTDAQMDKVTAGMGRNGSIGQVRMVKPSSGVTPNMGRNNSIGQI